MTLITSTFQTKFFLAALASAVIALAVAGVLFAALMRIGSERRDRGDARRPGAAGRGSAGTQLAATADVPELDAEADRLGALTGTRVTLIAPTDGSSATRPRRSKAWRRWRITASAPRSSRRETAASGSAERHSDTLDIDMLYVAVPVHHPAIASCGSPCR